MKSAYLSCIGGISGDMVLGAVIDAGVSIDRLNGALAGLNANGFSLSCREDQRGGVRGTRVSVGLDEEARRPRRFRDFVSICRESNLPPDAIESACAVFQRMEEAEATAHGFTDKEVHLHELGNLDTLVDVVGSVLGLEMLGIGHLYSSAVPSGSGIVDSAHGKLPAPAPATAALLAMARAPVVPPPGNISEAGEMVTPTGAAIVTTLATFRQPAMNLERVAYGLGSRESRHYPNVLALWIGQETGTAYTTDISLIETNIDDMSPEVLAYVQGRLFELGARDVWFCPIQMKKNRPATMLSALVPAELESQAVTLVMRETSSLGVRVRKVARYEAERETVEVDTSLGPVQVKVKRLDGSNVAVSPEYEVCRRIAGERDMSLQDVYRIVQSEAAQQLL